MALSAVKFENEVVLEVTSLAVTFSLLLIVIFLFQNVKIILPLGHGLIGFCSRGGCVSVGLYICSLQSALGHKALWKF